MARPSTQDYAPAYHPYVSLVEEDDLLEALTAQTAASLQFFANIPAGKVDHAYATGKWTIKQMLQHVIDAERIFAYRALRFARKDFSPLSSFDETSYAAVARVDHRNYIDMVEEFQLVRLASDALFRSLNEEELQRQGIASAAPVTVLALGYIAVGHAMYHQNVIRERYL